MDPPLVSETSFSSANPSSYSLAAIWPFSLNYDNGEPGGVSGIIVDNFGQNYDGFVENTTGSGPSGSATLCDVSVDDSTVTEQSGSRGRGRKRTDASSEDESKLVSRITGSDLSNGKRTKISLPRDKNGSSKAEVEADLRADEKPSEQRTQMAKLPKQDYIHVRARRGQATDSHSLAERARREKISGRMKILQDLVPGCNKIIGKALVLDEIINYVQSLQHQVEFLSMKLEAVNSRMTPTIEGFPHKDTFDAAGVAFNPQVVRDYGGASQLDWLHMQVGGSSERAA